MMQFVFPLIPLPIKEAMIENANAEEIEAAFPLIPLSIKEAISGKRSHSQLKSRFH